MKSPNIGYGVTLFELDTTPKGTSADHFGIIMVIRLTKGEDLRLGLASRAQWEEPSVALPQIDFRSRGSLGLFTSESELQWAQRAIESNPNNQRQLEIIDRKDLKHFGLVVNSNVLGGLLGGLDASVEPGTALVEIIKYLESSLNCNLRFGVEVLDVDDIVVETSDGVREEFHTIIATTGANYGGFLSRHTTPSKAGLRISRGVGLKSQPIKATVGPVIADGDTLAHHYPFFAHLPHEDPPQDASSAMRYDVALSARQTADGSIILGTTFNKDPRDEFRIDVAMTMYFTDRFASLITTEKLYGGAIWEDVYSCAQDP